LTRFLFVGQSFGQGAGKGKKLYIAGRFLSLLGWLAPFRIADCGAIAEAGVLVFLL
jgi:hypothetical protein